jgi:hypothetical protein
MQQHSVADIDAKIGQLDGAIAEMTRRGRTNGALDAIKEQRKTREALGTQRQREADVLVKLRSEQAGVVAKVQAIEVETAPIRFVAQLFGATTEEAIRLLILLMVLTCDPLAIVLTAVASSRK